MLYSDTEVQFLSVLPVGRFKLPPWLHKLFTCPSVRAPLLGANPGQVLVSKVQQVLGSKTCQRFELELSVGRVARFAEWATEGSPWILSLDWRRDCSDFARDYAASFYGIASSLLATFHDSNSTWHRSDVFWFTACIVFISISRTSILKRCPETALI